VTAVARTAARVARIPMLASSSRNGARRCPG
jgi:hypothetical protein